MAIIVLFVDCVAPNNRIHIRLYIQGFKEIVKFLCALGNLLAFASRDIEAKVRMCQKRSLSILRLTIHHIAPVIFWDFGDAEN